MTKTTDLINSFARASASSLGLLAPDFEFSLVPLFGVTLFDVPLPLSEDVF